MPGMSGLELLQHIKQKFAAPPPVVMMITASYVASKTIPMELPKSATGEATPVVLAVSICMRLGPAADGF